MFVIIDNQNSPMPNTTAYTHVESNLNGFIPIFLSKLQGNFKEMMVFSTNAPDQHLLLDTVAPSSICSEHWLHRAQLNPLKKFQLSTNTPPFRFAGRPICALYGVQLAATITDIKGRPRTLKLFSYVLPSTPISFLVRIVDQRRLCFDICLSEGHSSRLKISAWQKSFPITITSHVWIHFTPTHKFSGSSREWDDILSKYMFHSTTSIANIVTSDLDITTTYLIIPDDD